MNTAKPENEVSPKPCLYEGIITSIDHASQSGQADIGLGRGLVDIKFRYMGQNWIWNIDAYEDVDAGRYSSHAFCVDDIALLIYEAAEDEDDDTYIAVATLKEDRTELLKRWVWPLYPRDKSIIAKIAYSNDGNAGAGFPFIYDDGTREMLNPFTDQDGNTRALGTIGGPEDYLVITKEDNGNYTPHAAHEFMTAGDRFTFVPDVSGRTTPNFNGRIIGVSDDTRLLIDNVPFAQVGVAESLVQFHSGFSESFLFVNISDTGILTLYRLTVDLNTVNHDEENQNDEGISPVLYPFAISKGQADITSCIHSFMENTGAIDTIDMDVDESLSISKYAEIWSPAGALSDKVGVNGDDYRNTSGWYDNMQGDYIAVDRNSTVSVPYIRKVAIADGTLNAGEFIHNNFTFHSDEYGNISTSFGYTVETYGVHQNLSRIVGTETETATTPDDSYNTTLSASGTISYSDTLATISTVSGNLFTCGYSETYSHATNEYHYDFGQFISMKQETASINVAYDLDYRWENINICKHEFSASTSYSINWEYVDEGTSGYFTQYGVDSNSLTVSMIVFLHIDIKNGIFCYIKCKLNNNLDISTTYYNAGGYIPINNPSISYELHLSNRGVDSLLKTWSMSSPSGDPSAWTTTQDDDFEMFTFFRDELFDVKNVDTASYPIPNYVKKVYTPSDVAFDDGNTATPDPVCRNISVNYISKFWHTGKYNEFSLHPFSNKEDKWPEPQCIACPTYPFYEHLRELQSPFHNWVMLAGGYVTREGSSSANAYKYSYSISIGGYSDTILVEHADMGKITSCTGRSDAVVTLT